MHFYLKSLSLVWVLSISALLLNAQEIQCTIKGKIIGRDSKNLILHKATEEPRSSSIIIPIVDNTFEYNFTVAASEEYNLVFEDEHTKNMWRAIRFFPEDGEILFTLYPMKEGDKNRIEGGELNEEVTNYVNAMKEFHEEEISPNTAPLHEKIRELWKIDQGESPEADSLRTEIRVFSKKTEQWIENYMDNNPSLVTYSIFVNKVLMKKDYPKDIIRKRYLIFSELYPEHPYTELIRSKLESLESIAIGGKFIDFTAPDLNGNEVKLSEVIRDKVTLLDFWASWCGPCIRTSRTMIPVYEEYKNKGFSIVGIAREFKNSKAMERTMEREKFPWLNLIELDDQNKIWNKYNLSFQGGGTFLVGQNGEILAINPTAEELTKILQEML